MVLQKHKRCAKAMQKKKKKKERKENEQINDFSNTAFTTRVEMEFKI